jgi:hypothetical protein
MKKRTPACLSLGLLVTSLAASGCDSDLAPIDDAPVATVSSAISLNGALDPSFNHTGLRETPQSQALYTAALCDATSGMTVALANRHEPDPVTGAWVDTPTIVRYAEAGDLDGSWIWNAGTPRAEGFFNSPGAIAYDVVRAPEPVASGEATEGYYVVADLEQGGSRASVVARLDGSGHFDPAFQTLGVWTPVLPGYFNLKLSQLARDASGRILVGGVATRRKTSTSGLTFNVQNVVVARLDPATHQLDPTWGQGGWAVRELSSATRLAGMEIGRGRNDVFVGTPDSIVHFTVDGHIDPAIADVSDLRGIAVAADGRVFALGGAGFVAAFEASLQPLTTFGTNGTLDVKSFPDEDVYSIVYMPRIDRLFVSGTLPISGTKPNHAMVVAVTPLGTFDRRWSHGSSKMEVAFPIAHHGNGMALSITSDSKLALGVDLMADGPTPLAPALRYTGVARFLLTNLGVPVPPPPGPPGSF